jgi:hypothetical protein
MNFKKLSLGLTVAGLAFVTLTPKAQAFQFFTSIRLRVPLLASLILTLNYRPILVIPFCLISP